MLPTEGQGASQTSEGTEALGAFFENVMDYPLLAVVNSTPMEVFNAQYERANLIQQYSRQVRPATENGLKKVTLRPDEFMDYNIRGYGLDLKKGNSIVATFGELAPCGRSFEWKHNELCLSGRADVDCHRQFAWRYPLCRDVSLISGLGSNASCSCQSQLTLIHVQAKE